MHIGQPAISNLSGVIITLFISGAMISAFGKLLGVPLSPEAIS